MRVPAVAGVLVLALAGGVLAQPLLDASGATAEAASARGVVEERRLIDDGLRPSPRDDGWNPSEPPLLTVPVHGKAFGVLHIPALGEDYQRVLSQGIGLDVLDRPEIGHFPDTVGPGEVGNFALAGHRSTALRGLAAVVPGDRIVVQTVDGYYTYEVRTPHAIVPATAIEVVAAVPGSPGETPTERLLTLVTCYSWGDADRLILHAVFVEWRPIRAGAPAELG